MKEYRDLLIKRIVEAMNNLKESILSGDPSSYDQYRHDVGMLKGLELSRVVIVEAYSDMEEDET